MPVAFVTENLFLIAIALFSGGMLLWPVLAGRAAAGVSLDALGATRLINDENPVVVDLRDAAEYAKGHLTNALNIPASELDGRVGELSAKRPLLFYCESGARSGKAAGKLKSDGRDAVYSLSGGLHGWSGAGMPVVR